MSIPVEHKSEYFSNIPHNYRGLQVFPVSSGSIGVGRTRNSPRFATLVPQRLAARLIRLEQVLLVVSRASTERKFLVV